jgi:hypothetical protein
MSDGPFVHGANGLVMDVSFNGFAPGYATVGVQPNIASGESPNLGDSPSPGPWRVTQLLPGANIQLRGGGEFDLPSGRQSAMLGIGSGSNPVLGGAMGSIQVDITTGAAGTIQGLGFLTLPYRGTPTAYLGIWLDASNRPSFTITDANGAVQAVGAPAGAALPSGTVLQLRLFWDSTGTVIPGFVAFYSNGVPQPLGTVTGPWTSFTPASVLYGRGAVFSTFTLFAGFFHKFQAGGNATPTTSPIAPATSQTPP